ncbi:MAG: nucleotide exchange factor GrpE [Chitinispirillaceae bacterium]|nr:nucleotide exchange factor GrpE [Chitinispirillaceae bacterium]
MSKKKEHQYYEDRSNKDAAAISEEAVAETQTPVDSTSGDDADATEGTPDGAEAPEPEKSASEIINELKSQIKTAGDRYLRLMAEFDNYKKRTAREYACLVESANEKLMLDLIAVRETFELALKHGENGSDYQQLFDGIKLIFNKFDGVLSANGLTPFAAVGEPFDPQIHDALMKIPHEEVSEDHIADIHEKGYRLKDRIIKHARVIISAGKPPTSSAAASGASEEGATDAQTNETK